MIIKHFCIITFVISVVKTQTHCQYGLKACEFYAWMAWTQCKPSCGGVRYRMQPLCCEQEQNKQKTFDECLQSCDIKREHYFQTNYEQQTCKACIHGKLCNLLAALTTNKLKIRVISILWSSATNVVKISIELRYWKKVNRLQYILCSI